MYVLLTDIANILKVRLVYIIWLHISVRISLLRSANAYTNLAFRSIFLEERDRKRGKEMADGKGTNDY